MVIQPKLEWSGVLVTRMIGKERRISLNPRFAGRKELQALLFKLADAKPHLRTAAGVLSLRSL
jgi:hypothetical protein